MQRFDFAATPLKGAVVIQRKLFEDHRGFFSRFFCAEEFAELGLDEPIVQINHTLTRRAGAVRGMHFQYPPHAETKIVSCLRGRIFDVALDLRQDSETFLHWHGEELSADNGRSFFIPKGFAHGFQALTDDCELLYLHSALYAPAGEGALNVTDPRLAIAWPLPISDLSARDRMHSFIDANFRGISNELSKLPG